MERSPYQLVGLTGMFGDIFWRHDGSGHAAPEQKDLDDDVGSVHAGDAERDDIVESGGGTNVDQSDQTSYARCNDDCR